jgi:hypothetical protein
MCLNLKFSSDAFYAKQKIPQVDILVTRFIEILLEAELLMSSW